MKKSIVIALSLATILSACGTSPKNKNANSEKTSVVTPAANKKLLSVDVKIPLSLLQNGNENKDIETILKEMRQQDGIKNVVYDGNQTVTVSMTKEKHAEMMNSMKDSIKQSSEQLISDKNNSITKIEPSDDFSIFNVYVDPDKYSSIESFNALIFYVEAALYKSYNGDKDITTTVKFINEKTKEIIEEANSSSFINSNTEDSNTTKSASKTPPVLAEQLPYSIIGQKPDSLGNVYGKATYTNNSKYAITSFSIEATLPTSNENIYFISSDTVMPGESSSNFESSYEENLKINTISYTYVNENNEEVYVEYDVKLDKYDFY